MTPYLGAMLESSAPSSHAVSRQRASNEPKTRGSGTVMRLRGRQS